MPPGGPGTQAGEEEDAIVDAPADEFDINGAYAYALLPSVLDDLYCIT